MISAQTRSAFIARENRFTLFRIMFGISIAPEHRGFDAVIVDADRPARNTSGNAGTADRATAGGAAGQSPARGAAADA
jgi:hypothetical protein